MDALDATLERVVQRASQAKISDRDALLELLVDRIEAGGSEVADAPTPLRAVAEASPASAQRAGFASRKVVRIAGVGIAGWALVATGAAAAAAAAGVWFMVDSHPTPVPTPTTQAPPEPITRADAAGTTPLERVPAPSPPADTAGVVAGPVPAPQSPKPTPAAPGGHESSPNVIVDVPDVIEDVPEVIDDVTDTVKSVLPEGPVADTIAPVIDAVDVSGLISTLLCGSDASATVTATDNTGVTSVSLRVTTITGFSSTIALDNAGGGQWTGAVAPLSLLDLGLLNDVVHISVEARDAAGNVSTTSKDLKVSTGSC